MSHQCNLFVVDFECVCGTWFKTFTWRNLMDKDTRTLHIAPPDEWSSDIVFKQLNRSMHYENPDSILTWTSGEMEYDDWLSHVEIDPTSDFVIVNNKCKAFLLHQLGFRNTTKNVFVPVHFICNNNNNHV